MKLEIDNVELYFKHKQILKGIYLKSETGKVTGILGSNGSGKSCLMEIIFGSLRPKYKLVRIDNTPILKPLYQTNKVKLLPQFNLLPNNLKLKNIFTYYKVCWQTFISEFTEFKNFSEYKGNKLSGGERRIIETYIVLKSTNEIVLLDEPFTHLAPLQIERIKHLIAEEKQKKIIIITDHMYKHIIEVSDAIYLLKNGCTKTINNLKELEDYKYLATQNHC